MSFEAMAWAMTQKLQALEKITLLALSDYHNEKTGQCNPSFKSIAEKCGYSRDSAIKYTAILEEKGYCEIIENRISAKSSLSNHYILNFNIIAACCEKTKYSSSQPLPSSSQPLPSSSQPLGGSSPQPPKPVNIEPVIKCSVVSACEEKNSSIENNDSQQSEQIKKQPIVKTPENAMEWISYFVNQQGFRPHEAQSSKTVPMFVEWVKQGYTLEDVEMGIIGAMGWLSQKGETRAKSPCLFDGFIKTAITARQNQQAQKSPVIATNNQQGLQTLNQNTGSHYVTPRYKNQECPADVVYRESLARIERKEREEALRQQDNDAVVATYDSHLQPQVDFGNGLIRH